MLWEANPKEYILILFTAIDQRDWKVLKDCLTSTEIDRNELDRLMGVTLFDIKELSPFKYRLRVSVTFRDGPYNDKRNILIELRRNEKLGCFQAEPGFLRELLK